MDVCVEDTEYTLSEPAMQIDALEIAYGGDDFDFDAEPLNSSEMIDGITCDSRYLRGIARSVSERLLRQRSC